MLRLSVSGEERWDEELEEFVPEIKEHTLILEHSLLSISKWEAIYHKPFLSTEKDLDMIKTYAKCMSLNQVPDDVYDHLTVKNIEEITEYIEDTQTATWFSDNQPASKGGRMNGEIITAEIVYFWMVQMNIPVEFQKWHLNRLLTLIRVISLKSDPHPKKMSKREIMARNKALNAERRARLNTKG